MFVPAAATVEKLLDEVTNLPYMPLNWFVLNETRTVGLKAPAFVVVRYAYTTTFVWPELAVYWKYYTLKM